MRNILAAVSFTAAMLGGAAHAGTVYSYSVTSPGQMSDGGVIDQLSIEYDTDNSLSYFTSFSANNGILPEGGWMVLSPGNYPRDTAEELAILYLDFIGGDVYAYQYNGVQGSYGFSAFSWLDPSRHIQTFDDVISVNPTGLNTSMPNVWGSTGLEVSFSNLDVSSLMPGTFGADWTGVSFDSAVGIWAHFRNFRAFETQNGVITNMLVSQRTWYDVEDAVTTVPEPAAIAAVALLGVVGVGVYRRKRNKSA